MEYVKPRGGMAILGVYKSRTNLFLERRTQNRKTARLCTCFRTGRAETCA